MLYKPGKKKIKLLKKHLDPFHNRKDLYRSNLWLHRQNDFFSPVKYSQLYQTVWCYVVAFSSHWAPVLRPYFLKNPHYVEGFRLYLSCQTLNDEYQELQGRVQDLFVPSLYNPECFQTHSTAASTIRLLIWTELWTVSVESIWKHLLQDRTSF